MHSSRRAAQMRPLMSLRISVMCEDHGIFDLSGGSKWEQSNELAGEGAELVVCTPVSEPIRREQGDWLMIAGPHHRSGEDGRYELYKSDVSGVR